MTVRVASWGMAGEASLLHHLGVRFVSEPRVEPYGQIVVFLDFEGNRWGLLGPLQIPPSGGNA